MRPVTVRIAAVVLSLLCVAGCTDDTADQARTDLGGSEEAITVGSFDFTESRIVSEVYAQALDAWGYPAQTTGGGAPRELIEPALEEGVVDIVPEYAGAALLFLTGDPTLVSADPVATHGHLREAFASRGVAVLAAAPAQNQNALVVRRATATRHGLSKVSDLRTLAPGMVLGGPPECPTRPLCMVGYRDVYGCGSSASRSSTPEVR